MGNASPSYLSESRRAQDLRRVAYSDASIHASPMDITIRRHSPKDCVTQPMVQKPRHKENSPVDISQRLRTDHASKLGFSPNIVSEPLAKTESLFSQAAIERFHHGTGMAEPLW